MNGTGSGPVVIGIAGCSGSGKTSLAQELARELEGTHFHLDHYYRDLSALSYEERCRQNFDHPDSLESALLIADLRQLASGNSIRRPQYDFATHTRIIGESVPVTNRTSCWWTAFLPCTMRRCDGYTISVFTSTHRMTFATSAVLRAMYRVADEARNL